MVAAVICFIDVACYHLAHVCPQVDILLSKPLAPPPDGEGGAGGGAGGSGSAGGKWSSSRGAWAGTGLSCACVFVSV